MDYFTKHISNQTRRFPSPAPLVSFGDIRGKDHWIRRAFETCNFSFILSGSGEFHRKGQIWKVQAPFVLTQWPGEKLYYGPNDTWDEVFFIYHAKSMLPFRRMGFIDANRPVWPIHNVANVLIQIDELRELMHKPQTESNLDRIDRVCERAILESLATESKTSDEVVEKIIKHLWEAIHAPHDFDEIACKHGMSGSTLRRRWFDALGTTPGRYLLDLRIQKARRLLAETSMQVGQIAEQTGFQDMLYFSRRFKIETKLTPSQYRHRYRIPQ